MNLGYLRTLVLAVALVVATGTVRADDFFIDNFDGPSIDTNNWSPNDTHPNFAINFAAGEMTYNITGGMGGATSGLTHFWNGPLGKIGVDVDPTFPQVWTFKGRTSNTQTNDSNGGPRWTITDVFFANNAPPILWTNDNQSAVPTWFGLRITGRDDGLVQMFMRDEVGGDTIVNLDGGGANLAHNDTTWRVTIDPVTDTIDIDWSQGGAFTNALDDHPLEGVLASAAIWYPIVRHDNSSDWDWGSGNWAGVDSTATFDFIRGEIIPEPATLGLLAAAGLTLMRRRR